MLENFFQNLYTSFSIIIKVQLEIENVSMAYNVLFLKQNFYCYFLHKTFAWEFANKIFWSSIDKFIWSWNAYQKSYYKNHQFGWTILFQKYIIKLDMRIFFSNFSTFLFFIYFKSYLFLYCSLLILWNSNL